MGTKSSSTGGNGGGDVVSLEGVVKSPGGTSEKKIVVNIPSIEYPVIIDAINSNTRILSTLHVLLIVTSGSLVHYTCY